jgi:hypothetical protein
MIYKSNLGVKIMSNNDISTVSALPLENMPFEKVDTSANMPESDYTPNRKGIDAIKNALMFLIALARAIELSLKDKSFDILDALNFYEPAKMIFPFVNTFNDIPSEFLDTITDEEKQEIIDLIIKSGILPEKAESFFIEIVNLALHIKQFITNRFVNE